MNESAPQQDELAELGRVGEGPPEPGTGPGGAPAEPGGGPVAAAAAPTPPTAAALLAEGRALLSGGRAREALAPLRAALRQAPFEAGIHAALAALFLDRREWSAAELHVRLALALDPGPAESWSVLAEALARQELPQEAIAALRAAEERSADPVPLRRRIAALRRDLARAAAFTAQPASMLPGALRPLPPPTPRTRARLFAAAGRFLVRHRRPALALNLLHRALALDPDCGEARLGLGIVLRRWSDYGGALPHLERAARLMPLNADALHNLAMVQQNTQPPEAALASYDAALRLAPDDPSLRWNRSFSLLRLGRYTEGWAEYELRLDPRVKGCRPGPRWDGGPLDGHTILIGAEQGLGDMIQFVRYVPLVAERGGRVVLEVHLPLRRLFERFPGVAELVEAGGVARFQVQASLMSLPHLFGTTLETVPPPVVPPAVPEDGPGVAGVRAAPGLRAGIVWAGNEQHHNDPQRSMALPWLARLFDLPGVSWFSLQRDEAEAEIAAAGLVARLPSLGPRLADLADAAAVLRALDLVVTVDTAIAHLAGTLGRPVLLLLPYAAEWRWLHGRADCPWYPSMALVRQKAAGDWAGAVSEVAKLLASLPRRGARGGR